MTYEQIKALDELIAAVEKGEFLLGAMKGRLEDKSYDAFSGSLDAAKALHDALLPGWAWKLESYDGFSLAWVGPPSEMLLREHEADINNPARAWLIAILKAYRAQMDES